MLFSSNGLSIQNENLVQVNNRKYSSTVLGNNTLVICSYNQANNNELLIVVLSYPSNSCDLISCVPECLGTRDSL